MFRLKNKYAIENNLCKRRKPNGSFSIPENAPTRKVKEGTTKNYETGYFKGKTEWSSYSSIEEMRDADDISEDSSVFADSLSRSLFFDTSPQFDVWSFEGEFQPKAKSTPKHLETECLLRSVFNEEEDKFGEDFKRNKLPSITEELLPLFLTKEFHILDWIASITSEDEENLKLTEQHSSSKTLKNPVYSNEKISRRKRNCSMESQSNKKSPISNTQTRKRRFILTESSSQVVESLSSIFSTAPEMTPRKLFQDSQLCEKDSAPREMKTKSIQSNRNAESRTKSKKPTHGESVIISNSAIKTQSHLLTNVFTQKRDFPTSLKDIASSRRSFKTLGYYTQKKDQNLPVCFITTLKDNFHLG